ncbi:hypothetical protein FM076_17320 [Streptomyces albus subsp. chlorinus]|uniref:DUF6571 family protein n=1 Tax=Streptomyces albus TaxID=1888 RepID=UPI00156DD6CE|nr:DUF6571 family protein [Streptomyces albus]NSC22834.1 hypothetical protein [Streptomyces albus subsp. chlorinus]
MSDTLDYETVRNVNLTPLREAVKAWNKLPEDFREVHTTFDRTVTKPLSTERSGWHGASHKAAVKHFTVVQNQVLEAAGQAGWLGKEMSRCLKVIQGAKDDLKAVEEAVNEKPKGGGKNYLKLNTKDGVVYVDPPEGENSTGITKAYSETISELNKRIQKALRDAATADADLKKALTFDPHGKGFNDDTPQAQAKKDVDALYKLAGEKDFKRDPKLLSKFNGILAANNGNSFFAEEFATRKGAKGILKFWYDTAQPDYERDQYGFPKEVEPGKDLRKQLAALQDNLGNTLALASHSDSPKMTQWKQDVFDLGDKRLFTLSNPTRYDSTPPFGFQVMSNLMRTGKWDTEFLNAYGDQLVTADKKPYDFHGNELPGHRRWLSDGVKQNDFLNFGPKWDQGEDPFTGYFEALGHNSDASMDFFQDERNFDHVLRERTWLPDGEIPETGREKDFNGPKVALGHALGSATTGHDWDAPKNIPAEHTKEQADLMSKLIKGMGSMDEDGNADISLSPGMRPGLGSAAAEYVPDFFRAMKAGEDDDKLFPMSGAQAPMEHRDVTKFLVQLGQDPDANATITAGQKLYTAQVLDHHLGGDLPANQRYDAPPEDIVHEVLKTSGETAGTLASGAQEGIIGPAVMEDQDYDKSTLSKRLWGNGAFGTVVTGVSVLKPFAAHPVGSAVAAALIIGGEGAALSDHDAEHWSSNKSAPAADRAGGIYDEMAKRDVLQNERMLKAIGKEHGIDVSKSWAELYSGEGFNQGYSRVGSTASFLTSIEQVKQMAVQK